MSAPRRPLIRTASSSQDGQATRPARCPLSNWSSPRQGVRFGSIPLKNSVLEPECHVIKQLVPRLFDKG